MATKCLAHYEFTYIPLQPVYVAHITPGKYIKRKNGHNIQQLFFFLIEGIYFICNSCLLLLCTTLKLFPQNYGVKATHKITSWDCYTSHFLDTISSIIIDKMKIDMECFLVKNIVFNSSRTQKS